MAYKALYNRPNNFATDSCQLANILFDNNTTLDDYALDVAIDYVDGGGSSGKKGLLKIAIYCRVLLLIVAQQIIYTIQPGWCFK